MLAVTKPGGDLNQWKVDIGQELIEFVGSGHRVNEVERLPHPPTPPGRSARKKRGRLCERDDLFNISVPRSPCPHPSRGYQILTVNYVRARGN